MDRQTPETPETDQTEAKPRDAAAIAGELRALYHEAARSFAPANIKRACSMMADFADATCAELASLRERSEAAELEIAALRDES